VQTVPLPEILIDWSIDIKNFLSIYLSGS
jgi:hypothetical protein